MSKRFIEKKGDRKFIDEDLDVMSAIKWQIEITGCSNKCSECDRFRDEEDEEKTKKKCRFEKMKDCQIESEITIKDCNESATWNFNVWNSEETQKYQKHRLEKIDIAIKMLIEFKQAFVEAIDKQNSEVLEGKKLEEAFRIEYLLEKIKDTYKSYMD